MTARHPIPPTGPYDPIFGLQEKVASLLTPIFHEEKTGELFAYQVACRSLQAYEPESRADFINAGRSIAFGLASMLLMKEVFANGLKLEDKKRLAIHANALNRSADQAERMMMERRRYRRAYPSFPVPQEAEPDEAQVDQAVTARAAAQPTPPKPDVSPARPPIRPSAIHCVGPNSADMPPKSPDPLVEPVLQHAAGPNGSAPHPHLRSSGH